MSGRTIGGKKTAAKLLAEDPDYYRNLGKIGGVKKNPNKGFGSFSAKKRSAAGRKGGRRSRKPNARKIL